MPEIARSLWIWRALEHMKASSARFFTAAKLLQVHCVTQVEENARMAARRADA